MGLGDSSKGVAVTEHDALLRQARSDFAIFEFLRIQDRDVVPMCHPLHYLQMATEKLAKALFIAINLELDRFSHVAFSHIPFQLARADVAKKLGFRSFKAYRAFLVRAAPLFRAVDELNPSVGLQVAGGGPKDGPNVEYPWAGRMAGGVESWIVPAEYRFDLFQRLQRPGDAAQMLIFIGSLLDRFDAIVSV
jgi:hypothetical protein